MFSSVMNAYTAFLGTVSLYRSMTRLCVFYLICNLLKTVHSRTLVTFDLDTGKIVRPYQFDDDYPNGGLPDYNPPQPDYTHHLPSLFDLDADLKVRGDTNPFTDDDFGGRRENENELLRALVGMSVQSKESSAYRRSEALERLLREKEREKEREEREEEEARQMQALQQLIQIIPTQAEKRALPPRLRVRLCNRNQKRSDCGKK